jgi:hypothetical protein
MSEQPKREMMLSRRFLSLMRRERFLAQRIAAAGCRLDFTACECSCIHWAITELERLYPEAAAKARADLEREEGRRAQRRAARDTPGAP